MNMYLFKLLSSQHVSAKEAVLLYEETIESYQWREEIGDKQTVPFAIPVSSSTADRPTKQDRHCIVRFICRDD